VVFYDQSAQQGREETKLDDGKQHILRMCIHKDTAISRATLMPHSSGIHKHINVQH
jgi:hypothetical protein